ncbi:PepSY domain-containing protein [uncultured Thomasclavelia sp.]|uniref:PepSY domain-containing protein n=1 Tax=uncultured Thomasclavelia sp. TaxID=3025759 RepID=UPI0025D5EFE5|nr:PepSY domain-containing protein [uncultured Thomasclavelia sp.]
MKKILGLVLLGLLIVGCQGNNNIMSLDEAKEIALKEVNGEVIKSKQDHDDGRTYYEFEIITDNEKYDLEIDGETGDIVKKEKDDEYGGQTTDGQNLEAAVSEDRAKQIASDHIGGGGNLIKCKLDYDDGILKYEIEIIKDNIEYDIEVNANTGEIIKYEEDRY